MEGAFNLVSGEWILRWFAPDKNGGAVILTRALWVALTCFVVLQALTLLGTYAAGEELEFSDWVGFLKWLRNRLSSERSLLLAIAAGAYTALYTRFASQWQYLAVLYNQIKAKEIDVAAQRAACIESAADGSRYRESGKPDVSADEQSRLLDEWKMGFVVDAQHLHLSKKEPFKSVHEAWSEATEPKNPSALPLSTPPSISGCASHAPGKTKGDSHHI